MDKSLFRFLKIVDLQDHVDHSNDIALYDYVQIDNKIISVATIRAPKDGLSQQSEDSDAGTGSQSDEPILSIE